MELARPRADLGGDRRQGVEVEVVAAHRVEPEQEAGLLHRDLAEVGGEPHRRVGPGALGVRVVGAPHQCVDAVGVAAADLRLAHRRRPDEHVGPEVLGREPLDRAPVRDDIFFTFQFVPAEHHVGLEQEVAHPPGPTRPARTGGRGTVELAGQEQLPQRPVGPERHLEHELRHVLVVGGHVGLAGVGVHHQPGLGAGGPHRVVGRVPVRRLVVPHRGDQDPLDAGLPASERISRPRRSRG